MSTRLETRKDPIPLKMPELGLTAFSSYHAPDFSMPLVRQNYNKILVFEVGIGTFEYEGRSQPIHAPAMVRTAVMAPHRTVDKPGHPTVIHGICITDEALSRFEQIGSVWRDLMAMLPESEILPISNGFHAQQYCQFLRRMLLEVNVRHEHVDAMLLGLANILLVTMLRNLKQAHQAKLPVATAPGIAETVEYINHHFTKPLTVQQLANQAGMAYRTFTQHFRRATGMTVLAYINQLRAQYAAQHLLATGDVMSSAFIAGFGDLGHFYRIFKRAFGTSPQKYIKQQSGEVDDVGSS